MKNNVNFTINLIETSNQMYSICKMLIHKNKQTCLDVQNVQDTVQG